MFGGADRRHRGALPLKLLGERLANLGESSKNPSAPATDRWLPMAMSTRARTNSPGSTVFWPQWAARIFSVIVRPRTGPMLRGYLRPNNAGRNVERPGHWVTMNNESNIASTNGQTAREISSKDSLAMLAAT